MDDQARQGRSAQLDVGGSHPCGRRAGGQFERGAARRAYGQDVPCSHAVGHTHGLSYCDGPDWMPELAGGVTSTVVGANGSMASTES